MHSCQTNNKHPQGKIPYRIFWTWDHSTNWCLHVPGAQNSGVANPYTKEPDFFVEDYKRAVDWCADNGMDAVGIVGMLRDQHHGVDHARRICAYARQKGVRIYIIAGLYAYGGIFYEGDHPYSLTRFFDRHPECIGKRKNGEPLIVNYRGRWGYKSDPRGCPSKKILNDFVLESLDWLFKAIPELGGIQMEAGDSGVCQCPDCQARRGKYATSDPMSFADMAGIYPQAAQVIRARNRDAWIICETYHHFLDPAITTFFSPDNHSEELRRLLEMPDEVFWQWKCDARLEQGTWKEGDQLPEPMRKFNHVMRAHSGTQWKAGRHTLAIDKIRRQCRLSYLSGLQCVSMFGEGAPFHTNAECNYLALQYFADNPLASVADFAREVMASRLGGYDPALKYIEYADLIFDTGKIPEALKTISKIISAQQNYDVLRRWFYLASFINGYYWEAQQSKVDRHEKDIPKNTNFYED